MKMARKKIKIINSELDRQLNPDKYYDWIGLVVAIAIFLTIVFIGFKVRWIGHLLIAFASGYIARRIIIWIKKKRKIV